MSRRDCGFQSVSGQRINSLNVIETDAVYRNPRFRSIVLGQLPRMGLEKENLFTYYFILFAGCSINYKRK